MPHRMMVSALFVAGLFAVAAAGQPPANDDPNRPQKNKQLGEKVKPADPTHATVTAALANDPDVLVARAKVQLAEAELTKAKQGVVLKVMTLDATIEEHKREVETAQARYRWAEQMVQKGVMDQAKLMEERGKLGTAQAALARAETELKLLTGGGKEQGVEMIPGTAHDRAVASGVRWLLEARPGEDAKQATATAFLARLEAYRTTHTIKGPIPDRIRAALDKPVKLGAKGEKVAFEKAMEVFKKDAGLDVPVRGPNDLVNGPQAIVSHGEELPVGAWLQLFQDYAGKGIFYVRDYGLLYTDKTIAPPDAPTLTEFWKQKLATAKTDGAPESKK